MGFNTVKAALALNPKPAFGSKPRTAATTETTGYARAFRHAVD
jgi:hypothetical protein